MYVLTTRFYVTDMATVEEQLPQYDMNVNAPPAEQPYIRRTPAAAPALVPPKHPHGTNPGGNVHPSKGEARAKSYGNDNSSVNRQSRVQGQRPDPIAGESRSTGTAARPNCW